MEGKGKVRFKRIFDKLFNKRKSTDDIRMLVPDLFSLPVPKVEDKSASVQVETKPKIEDSFIDTCFLELSNKVLIINLLKSEVALVSSISKIAKEENFSMDFIYAKVDMSSRGQKIVIRTLEALEENENPQDFNEIIVFKDRTSAEEGLPKKGELDSTDKIKERLEKFTNRVLSYKGLKPSNNVKFFAYRVKKLIEDRINFYKSVGETENVLVKDFRTEANDADALLADLIDAHVLRH